MTEQRMRELERRLQQGCIEDELDYLVMRMRSGGLATERDLDLLTRIPGQWAQRLGSATLRLWACRCAKRVVSAWHRAWPGDERLNVAVRTAEEFARGVVGVANLNAALVCAVTARNVGRQAALGQLVPPIGPVGIDSRVVWSAYHAALSVVSAAALAPPPAYAHRATAAAQSARCSAAWLAAFEHDAPDATSHEGAAACLTEGTEQARLLLGLGAPLELAAGAFTFPDGRSRTVSMDGTADDWPMRAVSGSIFSCELVVLPVREPTAEA